MKRAPQETFPDKIYRYKSVILVVCIPLLLVSFVLFLMPQSQAGPLLLGRKSLGTGSRSYAVIFDAGSSGSRVHVFCFDQNLDLIHIGKELELFKQKKPGLSSYAEDPMKAADSLVSLLKEAEKIIPLELRPTTPVRVGATAGLRNLGDATAENILQAVRDLLKEKSSLKYEPEWVTVLDGSQEGAYEWVTINYLLGNLGEKYSKTVGVVDLGGGSVQMAYAISEREASKAPIPARGEEDKYVKELLVKGRKYYLYVHSYLHYGLLAGRAEILKVAKGSYSNCVLSGDKGSYKYGGEVFTASPSPSGASFSSCRTDAIKALKADEATCTHMQCTFGGIWNGGGGDGQKNLFVASFFFDRAAEAGFVDPALPVAKVKPLDFMNAATRACKLTVEETKAAFPAVQEENLPYLCMDLVYQYTLLVDGFALKPSQEITLVKKIHYGDALVEAAWPLGSAIELASML